MIYLKNTSEAQVLMIPRDGDHSTGEMSLVVKSTIDRTTETYSVNDLGTSPNYFHLAISLHTHNDGEYEYELKKGEVMVSCGLLIIGDYKAKTSEYKNIIRYEQYK